MGRELNVLIAEDTNVSGMLLEKLLLKSGCHVTWVQDGQAALDTAKGHQFDLAIIDIRMPLMTGLEFTRRYRNFEQERNIYPGLLIIGASVENQKSTYSACLESGMNDFITKPYRSAHLNQVLDYALKRIEAAPDN